MKKNGLFICLMCFVFMLCGCDSAQNTKETPSLAKPTILSIRAKSSTSVYLKWMSVSGADRYCVKYADLTENDGTVYIGTTTSGISATVEDLSPNTEYAFMVMAISDSIGSSPLSDPEEVTTPAY